jgi:tetratricopeptide (TPR) repeat protein
VWSEVTLVALGFAAMSPWIFLIMSRQILILQKHIPSAGLKDTCGSLVRLGILQAHNDSYRFRHQQLAQKLAQEALVDLCDQGKLGHFLYPEAAATLTDRRLTAQALAKDASLTRSAVEECSRFSFVVVERALYLYYGALQPAEALPPLQSYADQRPDTELRALIAEVLSALGRRDEAWAIWQEAAELHSGSTWFLNRWARALVLAGDPDGATKALRRKLDGLPPGSAPYEELLLAELQCRFGSEVEQESGIATLDRLQTALEPYVGSRAATEFARVKTEVFGDLDEGKRLLDGPFDDGSMAALRMTRRAQIHLLEDNTEEAKVLAREAARIVTWDDDPTHQLEVLATNACLSLDAVDIGRVKALLGFGWRLVGRDGQALVTGNPVADELIDRTFLPLNRELDSDPA